MQWHLCCRVVDNFGDVGTAWRLAADLAGRGEQVCLAIDNSSALAWMAPQGQAGVEVTSWQEAPRDGTAVIVELFGGGLSDAAAVAVARPDRPPVAINLEHLTAEAYAERSHRLPSPRRTADGRTATTWFFYPGFASGTGGLLREPALLSRRQSFNGERWLAEQGFTRRPGERVASLFCYRNDAVAELIAALASEPTLLLVAPGFACEQAAAVLGPSMARAGLRAVALPLLPQPEFDHLLWASDLNCVRGEDSIVRALWAGAPFLWQLYVQDDAAHAAKLDAFLALFLAGAEPGLAASLRRCFMAWNGFQPAGASTVAATLVGERQDWAAHCVAFRAALAARPDLATQLIDFARAKQ